MKSINSQKSNIQRSKSKYKEIEKLLFYICLTFSFLCPDAHSHLNHADLPFNLKIT